MNLASLEQKLHKPDLGLLLLRLVFGVAILFFGLQKFAGGSSNLAWVGGNMAKFGINFAPVFWGVMSATAESLGGLCLITGLFFRPAALILVFNMVVATVVMWGGGPDFSSFDAMNGWLQKAGNPIYFTAIFLGLMLLGPGRFALRFGGEKAAVK